MDKPPRKTAVPQATSRKGPSVKKGATSGPKVKTPKGTTSRSITPPLVSPGRPASTSRGSTGVSSPRPPGLLTPATPGGNQSRRGARVQSSPAPLARLSRSEIPAPTRTGRTGLAVTDPPPPPTRVKDSQSTSLFDQCSGIPRILLDFSQSSESSLRNKKRKHKTVPSSSGDSPRKSTHRPKKNKGVSSEIFLKAFQDINLSLAALTRQQQWGSTPAFAGTSLPASTFPDPDPGLILPDTCSMRGEHAGPPNPGVAFSVSADRPPTPGRDRATPRSPAQISLHPSMNFGSPVRDVPDIDVNSVQPPSTHSQDVHSEEEEVNDPCNFSPFETQLRLIQIDMVRVLQLPESSKPETTRRSFKRRTGVEEPRDPAFPAMPMDRLCTDRIQRISDAKKWTAFNKRAAAYFQFPEKDREDFFTVPLIPDTAKDKLTGDSGKAPTKSIFVDKTRAKMEETMKKVDKAARFGSQTNAFLLLLSEYIVCACEEDSQVPADMLAVAFRCLDEILRFSLDQFTRISLLSTRTRRTNVVDALYIPHEGAKKKLEDLPLMGKDLFGGKFQEILEVEAKRIETSDKLSLKKPLATNKPKFFKKKAARGAPSFRPALMKPFKPYHQQTARASAGAVVSAPRPYSAPAQQNVQARGRGRGGPSRGFGWRR